MKSVVAIIVTDSKVSMDTCGNIVENFLTFFVKNYFCTNEKKKL